MPKKPYNFQVLNMNDHSPEVDDSDASTSDDLSVLITVVVGDTFVSVLLEKGAVVSSRVNLEKDEK